MKVYTGQSLQNAEMSEKFDGVRATWNGAELVSRTGNTINAPEWWTADLPKRTITGELFAGRGMFDEASGTVRSKTPDDRWRGIRFMVFDGIASGRYCETVKRITVLSKKHLNDFYNNIISNGGEGVVIKINGERFKMKPKSDTEGTVIDHIPGKGKHAGLMGALLLELHDGKRFKLGNGFSDADRKNPPEIGSVVRFDYEGLTSKGLPRFARYSGVRIETNLDFTNNKKIEKTKLKFKSGRGGKREGAGRPKGSSDTSEANRRVHVSVRLPRWLKIWLSKQTKNPAQLIEVALIEHYKLRK